MFFNGFLKSFRILLIPFSIFYWVAIWVRNKLYDAGVFKSVSFNLPVINVGNLSVGGTGKSPMIEYLTRLLQNEQKISILSRGYKRKTKGYNLANEFSTALEIGDEPLQFHKKFPGVAVAVGEERIVAIPQLLHDRPETDVILLDDAFQHRAIKAGLNILLTDCNNLFTRDFYLPAGDLRDLKKSYQRADIIVVTKCPFDLSKKAKEATVKEIDPLPHQHIFFTTIEFGLPYHILSYQQHKVINEQTEVLLVTGIANPGPLKSYLDEQCDLYNMMTYRDHHIFTIDDWKDIGKRFASMESQDKIILTTEKDAMRLIKFESKAAELPLFVIPIEHRFLFNEGPQFDQLITKFIEQFNPKNEVKGLQETILSSVDNQKVN